MTVYRKLFDPRFISAEDLDGKEVTVTIKAVDKADVYNQLAGAQEQKPTLHFAETPKMMVLNITNAKKLASIYGRHYEEWVGKRITLYPQAVRAFGAAVDGIRIKKPAQATNAQ